MAIMSPVYTVIVPFLFFVTIPLAVFAGITTTLAFSVLAFRVMVVYIDIALSLVPQCFATRTSRHSGRPLQLLEERRPVSPAASSTHSNDNSPTTPTPTQRQSLYRRRRRRPSSATSLPSAGSSELALGLMPSVGAERDFEGIGGWRSGRDGDDDTWTAINSRFELPDRAYARSHHRSPSGGALTPGDSGVLMMKIRARSPDAADMRTSTSPNSSRARTPSVSRVSVVCLPVTDGYFPLAMSPTATKKLVAHQL